MKKVLSMLLAAIAIAFAVSSCDPNSGEVILDEESLAAFNQAYDKVMADYNNDVAGTILSENFADEKYATVVAEYKPIFSAIETDLKALKAAAEEAYKANTLKDELDTMLTSLAEIAAKLKGEVESFMAAIAAINAGEKQAENDAAYETFAVEYESLCQQYTMVYNATVANEEYSSEAYTEFIDEQSAILSGIQQNIQALSTWADESYTAGTLAADLDEILGSFEGIQIQLTQFLNSFNDAIAAFANDAAYEAFAVEYESLQQQWSQVYNATCANEDYDDPKYYDVIDEMIPIINGIYQQMEQLQTWADESYNAGTLAADLDEILSNFEQIQIMLTQFLNTFNDAIQNLAFTIKFETTTVLYNKISATATVNDPEIYYLFQCEQKSYVDSFSSAADLMSAELEYWYNKYGTSYADYQFDSYADLLLNGLCYSGDSECTFPNLKESTDYVIYGFAIDSETLQPASELFTLEVSTPEVNWVKLGVGTLTEPFTTMFGEDALVISVDVYQESSNPGLYMYKGVGLQLANWFYEQDMTAYEGSYWDDEGIIFDATDPDNVVIDNQYYGFNAGSSYGWPVITTIANGQTVGYGKLANGHLTLTARQYLVGMGTSFYYGPAGYDLALPSAATYVAPSKVNYVEKGERSARTLVSAPASAKETISTKHNFSRSRR